MSSFNRRSFLKTSGLVLTSLAIPTRLSGCQPNKQTEFTPKKKNKSHIITLSFDDGFKKSSIRTAKIYEKYNLSACINVIATGHLDTFEVPDKYHAPRGDFGLWNELKQRGHEIMPHGYKHVKLPNVSFKQAKGLILRCLDYFSDNLKDFKSEEAIFNFPYNASTPELESWLPTQVIAFRVWGTGINPLPYKDQVRLTCTNIGPGNCEQHLEEEIQKLLSRNSGWLIYNTHGLDSEGWGPIRSSFLERLLEKLLAIDSVSIMPAARALSELANTA